MKKEAKKAAKPAVRKAPAKKAEAPDSARAKKDLADLVDALGPESTVDAMIIAAAVAKLDQSLPKAISDAVDTEVRHTVDAVFRITQHTEANAKLVVKLVKEVVGEVGSKVSEVFSKCDVALCSGKVDRDGNLTNVKTVASTIPEKKPEGK